MHRGHNKQLWGLDALMDNLLITEEPQPHPRRHSATPQPAFTAHRASQLSHHNSLASSASTRSTQSRSSLFSTASSSTNATLPVTMYQVPHSYDDEPQTTPQPTAAKPAQRVINISAAVCTQQPHYVVAAFGMTNVAHWLFDNVAPDRESAWRVDSADCTLTYSPFVSKQRLLDLGERIGVSAFVVIVSSIAMLYQQLDVLSNSLDSTDSDKLWWRRLIIVYDQAPSTQIQQERETILVDEIPKVLPHYSMTHTPAVMFVSAYGQGSADYSLQCKQVLRQLIDTSHRLGRWRPDEDEDDFLDAAVIHITPQGRMPVRSMTRYNR